MKSNKEKYPFSQEQKRAALLTGFSLLIMAVTAGAAYGAIQGQLFFPGDRNATNLAVQSSPALLITESVLWVIILITDIIVSVKLFVFFKTSGKGLSLGTAVFRLIYSTGLAAAIVFLLRAIEPGKAYDSLTMFSRIWSLSLIFFGIHLTLLAAAAFKSGFVPLFLSLLLVTAGPAYSAIHLLYNGGERFEPVAVFLEKMLAIPMTAAELLLAIWLLMVAFSGRKASS